ncbi:response regulator [Trichlorobacter ammonificans]|uniref:histidine kinase n=1 Tax=Trichlorobacter ammonificans TaxID=2916410 RepID=A0ABN8HJ54_9BACT|nr:response regulator [Trichlorobacter ammonificans]CAH2031343.1 putative Histidine kinase [Trichlorobacter ammonificans]
MSDQLLSSADKILVVDDDLLTREFARTTLEPAGFEVTDATSGEEAMTLLDRYVPDLILLDVMMPGMDGFKTCRAIREHPSGTDIPVLMMTGLDDLTTIARSYKVGITDFISKPIKWGVLPYRIAFIIRSSRVNRALRENEERNRSFFEYNQSVMLVVDTADGAIVDANPAACGFYGWSREDMKRKHLCDIVAASRNDVREAVDRALAKENNHCFFQHRLADGSIRDVETFCSPVTTANTSLLIIIVHDITERRKMEERLIESENRFRFLMDMTPNIAVQGYRLDGTTTYWNRASEQLYGYTPEEAIGKSLLNLIIPPVMREQVLSEMVVMGETGRPIPAGELQLMRKDGTLVSVYSSHALIQPPGREPELFCVDIDLTPLKQTEQELRQARNAAEAANEAKSNFLATMSHEIRTPLGALTGNLELLAQTPLGRKQQQYLNDCRAASRMLLQVINDVLDFSKVESGRLELVSKPFSVAATAKQLVRIFAPAARRKGLTLAITLASDLPEYIDGDQLRISQIITNLLSNAIKFTRKGTISLEICCRHCHEHDDSALPTLEITVRDTGIGIPVEDQEKIFESFRQLESFGSRHFSGTGLGLAISRRLADLMGGSITVFSVPEQGSEFRVALPATVCEAPEQNERQHGRVVTPRSILLADDDQLGRSMMCSLLEGKGHRVTVVENGSRLLEALANGSFDIVLTDISMPDIDGSRAARIIRSGERPEINPQIPIIAITAHAFSRDREAFLAAGINGFVPKPVDMDELLRQIEAVCAASSLLKSSG